MTIQTFRIQIEGCWKDEKNTEPLPRYPGLFFVFEAKPNGKGILPLRLIYVGASEKIREGVLAFRKGFDGTRYLRDGNMLCYHTAQVGDSEARDRIQAAFIYTHKPPGNDKFKYQFPFPETRVVSEGQIGFLKHDFTV